MKTRIVLFFMAGLLGAAGISVAYPTPAVVQKIDQWTFKTTYTQPEQIMLKTPGGKTPQRFWYIILSVTNQNLSDEVAFFPVCQLVTDTFEVIDADKHVSADVFNWIKRKHQGSYPFLESLDFKDNRVLPGKDNTRDFVIIWPDFDPKAKVVNLFIGGLSNETAVVEHPALKGEDGNPKKIFLQKTLALKYAVAGDVTLRANTTVKPVKQDWVMR